MNKGFLRRSIRVCLPISHATSLCCQALTLSLGCVFPPESPYPRNVLARNDHAIVPPSSWGRWMSVLARGQEIFWGEWMHAPSAWFQPRLHAALGAPTPAQAGRERRNRRETVVLVKDERLEHSSKALEVVGNRESRVVGRDGQERKQQEIDGHEITRSKTRLRR